MEFAIYEPRVPSAEQIDKHVTVSQRLDEYETLLKERATKIIERKNEEVKDWLAFSCKAEAYGRLEADCSILRTSRHLAIRDKFLEQKLTTKDLDEYFKRMGHLDHFLAILRLQHSDFVFEISDALLDDNNPNPFSDESQRATVRRLKDIFLTWKPVNKVPDIMKLAEEYKIEVPDVNDEKAWERERELLQRIVDFQKHYDKKREEDRRENARKRLKEEREQRGSSA
ncbi:hypothetical protein CLIM01_06775 [Colletotrichum limetticola]|uniref:Uncharacterized protein n=1 Tax=Colletotrichum limetticola TaxID=1209924 RepID=A0ABQ9PWF0_9PEZI|nr:hypothetical protein CLIM01_06775 [Colletotrichum limetticola]